MLRVRTLEQITREFYERVSSGDVAGVIDLVDDDIIWSIPGPSVIPYAGTYRGKEGVAEFFRILAEHEDLQSFVPNEFIFDQENGVACILGCEKARAILTGRSFSTTWAEVFHVRGGLVTAFEEHIDTFKLAEAYTP